jgi:hypothetical protein
LELLDLLVNQKDRIDEEEYESALSELKKLETLKKEKEYLTESLKKMFPLWDRRFGTRPAELPEWSDWWNGVESFKILKKNPDNSFLVEVRSYVAGGNYERKEIIIPALK